MMRILYVSDITSVHTMRWVRYMVNHGYEVVVLSVRPGEVKGARVIYLDPGDKPAPKWLRIFRQLWFVLNEWRMIEMGGFDIVHVHYLRSDLTGLVATLHPNSIISAWGSDVRPVSENGDPRRIGLRRRALERAKVVTAVNLINETNVRKMAPAVKRVEIIPFGVDLSLFNPRGWQGGKPGEIVFCVPKLKLVPLYGQDIAVKALARVVKRFPGARLILTGDGEPDFMRELKSLVRKYRLQKHVRFTGRVDYHTLLRIFERSDAILQPSRWDTFGGVVLDAGAVGLPSISTTVGGLSDLVINGVTGLTVEPDDETALAQAMINLAEDPELRARLGQNARDLAKNLYSFDMHAKRMEAIYGDLVSGKSS